MANQFEAEIARSFKINSPGLPYPMECLYEYIRLSVPQIMRPGMARAASTGEQPCDALVDVLGGPGLALELKELGTRACFPFHRLPDHQLKGLQRFNLLGRNSYLLICYRKWTLTKKQLIGLRPMEVRALQERRAYGVPLDALLTEMATAQTTGAKSLSAELVDSVGIRLLPIRIPYPTEKDPKAKQNGWDISPLL